LVGCRFVWETLNMNNSKYFKTHFEKKKGLVTYKNKQKCFICLITFYSILMQIDLSLGRGCVQYNKSLAAKSRRPSIFKMLKPNIQTFDEYYE